MSIRINDIDKGDHIQSKLQYLILIVKEFKLLKQLKIQDYHKELKYAAKQMKKIKTFIDKYKTKSPITLRKYSSINNLG